MPRIAFLTIDDMEGFVADDKLAEEPLAEQGFEVEGVPWDADVDWRAFQAAVIRSTWDYQDRLDDFLSALTRIEESGCRLFNPVEIVRWNSSKRYLQDLADRGVPIVPTLFRGADEPLDLAGAFGHFTCHDLVVKPSVGASAFDTFRIQNLGGGAAGPGTKDSLRHPGTKDSLRHPGTEDSLRHPGTKDSLRRSGTHGLSRFAGSVPILRFTPEAVASIEELFRGRESMIQPFVPEILDPGETSLFFFDGRFSHAVVKTPPPGDFRVQEEYGGVIEPDDPPLDLVETCGAIAGLFDPPPLYARVDIVRTGELFLLMELELIEPALYFRIVPGSAERFADALVRRLGA